MKVAARVWFQSMHVDGPDHQAAMDYFWLTLASMDMPENPTTIYYCDQSLSNGSLAAWRFGSLAANTIPTTGMNEEGLLETELVEGVEDFDGKVLFLAGSCNELIGPEFQQKHLPYFKNAEMVVIENAGHTMFGEKPEETQAVVRAYFEE